MDVEAAPSGGIEHPLRQDQPIGDHDTQIDVEGLEKRLLLLIVPYFDRLRTATPARSAAFCTGEGRNALPRCGARRLGIDMNDLMPGGPKGLEYRHCEIRRAHENQTHGVSAFLFLGEAAHDHVALELGEVIDK